MFRLWALILLILVFQVFSFADTFYLENGSTIEGQILSETDQYFHLKISVGTTKVSKNKITKHQKTDQKVSADNEFEMMKKKASTKEDWIEVSDYAFEKGWTKKGVSYLRRAWVVDGKKDAELKKSIDTLIHQSVKRDLETAKEHYRLGRYSECVSSIDSTLYYYPRTKLKPQLKKLKSEAFTNMLSDDSSFELYEEILSQFKYYGNKSTSNRQKSSSNTKDKEPPFKRFKEAQYRAVPQLAKLYNDVIKLKSMSDYIQRKKMDEYASDKIYSVREIDAARANRQKFLEVSRHNNLVYKSKSVVQGFNVELSRVRQRFNQEKNKVDEESKEWIKKGYEKINGEWLSEMDAKKAKGWVLYRGEWLNSKSKDFHKEKSKIDEKYTIKTVTPKVEVGREKIKGEKKPVSIEDLQDDLLNRNPKNIFKNVGSTLKEEVQEAVDNKVKKVSQKADQVKAAVKQNVTRASKSQKTKGLPTHIGIGIIIALVLLIKMSKKK